MDIFLYKTKQKGVSLNIILFDGVCNLCEASVQFIIKHDKNAYFHFASQQSETGKKLLKKYKLEEFDTIVLISNNQACLYSDAVLEVSKHLDGFIKYMAVFRFLPRGLRDFIYKIIAKYRYRFFGRKDRCMMPTLEMQSRLLT